MLDELKERLQRASASLEVVQRTAPAHEWMRLRGKIEGVELALSYVTEMTKHECTRVDGCSECRQDLDA